MSVDPAARGARAAYDMREDERDKRRREDDEMRRLMIPERGIVVDECRWGKR